MPFSKELFLLNGTRYTNAFAQSSICCPARCQILSGLMGHNTGVLANAGTHGGLEGFVKPHKKDVRMKDSSGRCYNNEDRTIAVYLSKFAKYKTHMIGKYLNGVENLDTNPVADHIPPGWTDVDMASTVRFYNGHGYTLTNWTEGQKDIKYHYYGYEEEAYSADVIVDRMSEYMDRHRTGAGEGAPLFSYICSTAPHFPIMPAYRHMKHLDYWARAFDSYVSNRPSYFNKTEVMGKARWLREGFDWRVQSEWTLRIDFAKRMGSLYAIDDMVKGIYNKVKQIGELDNTVFIFTSDNGYNLGMHSLQHKMSPYDEASKVPLYITGPGFAKNAEVSDLVLLADIAPTVLDLAGLQIPSDLMDSISLLPKQPSEPSPTFKRDFVFLQYKEEHNPRSHTIMTHEDETVQLVKHSPNGFAFEPAPFKAIRTKSLMYVCYYMIPSKSYVVNSPEDIMNYLPEHVDVSVLEQECELYDTTKDPYQMNNIVKETDVGVIKRLDDMIDRLQDCSGRSCYEERLDINL